MRKEWRAKGYADGVAYVGKCEAGVCPNCGADSLVYVEHDGCAECVEASVMYSHMHGILSDGLAELHTFGRVLPRVDGALVAGFISGVRAGLAGVAR